MESRLWKLLWDSDPNGLLVLDPRPRHRPDERCVLRPIPDHRRRPPRPPGTELLGDTTDFEHALESKWKCSEASRSYPELDLYVRKVIFPVPGEGLVAGIFVDMTAAWRQRQYMEELRRIGRSWRFARSSTNR